MEQAHDFKNYILHLTTKSYQNSSIHIRATRAKVCLLGHNVNEVYFYIKIHMKVFDIYEYLVTWNILQH